jgi:hypothetical protein
MVVEPTDMSSFLYNFPHAPELAHNKNSVAASGKLEERWVVLLRNAPDKRKMQEDDGQGGQQIRP